DTITMTFSLPGDKILRTEAGITSFIREHTAKGRVRIRLLASLLGSLNFAADYACPIGRIFLREAEMQKVEALGKNSEDFDAFVRLSQPAIDDLSHWLHARLLHQSCSIADPVPELTLRTDASQRGWGMQLVEREVACGGRWTNSETGSINFLELLAVQRALSACEAELMNCCVLLQSDNVTCVAHLNNFGGSVCRRLNRISKQILCWCSARGIRLKAQHIPGKDNHVADFHSRVFSDETEWSLCQQVFVRICQVLQFQPRIDLFASSANAKLRRFMSWAFDSDAVASDAFAHSWTGRDPYIFSPFSLMPRCLRKIVNDAVALALIVAPCWPTQLWFSQLLDMSVSPICLFSSRRILGVSLPRHFELLAVLVTGATCRRQIDKYRRRFSTLSPRIIYDRALGGSTRANREPGKTFYRDGVSIPVWRLQ
ncbi:MAG: hypothetical protein V2I33_17700, partial [Kangiellaceae bacterium]|nr:hypothetical protein [Kangiellaceae bacterium]